jgi:hypothetical protein
MILQTLPQNIDPTIMVPTFPVWIVTFSFATICWLSSKKALHSLRIPQMSFIKR